MYSLPSSSSPVCFFVEFIFFSFAPSALFSGSFFSEPGLSSFSSSFAASSGDSSSSTDSWVLPSSISLASVGLCLVILYCISLILFILSVHASQARTRSSKTLLTAFLWTSLFTMMGLPPFNIFFLKQMVLVTAFCNFSTLTFFYFLVVLVVPTFFYIRSLRFFYLFIKDLTSQKADRDVLSSSSKLGDYVAPREDLDSYWFYFYAILYLLFNVFSFFFLGDILIFTFLFLN